MRHALILILANVFLAIMTAFAWQYDTDRATQAQREKQQAVDARLLKLETDYLQGARSLITMVAAGRKTDMSSQAGLSAQDRLLEDIDSALADFPDMQDNRPDTQDNRAREAAFDALVLQIQAELLRFAPETSADSIIQEWRRQNDRMNGALHRRNLLLEQTRQ